MFFVFLPLFTLWLFFRLFLSLCVLLIYFFITASGPNLAAYLESSVQQIRDKSHSCIERNGTQSKIRRGFLYTLPFLRRVKGDIFPNDGLARRQSVLSQCRQRVWSVIMTKVQTPFYCRSCSCYMFRFKFHHEAPVKIHIRTKTGNVRIT